MATYDEASIGSASLCDQLFERLAAKIPTLKRRELTKSCAIFQQGKKPFAYVYYRKNADAVEVWCRGDVRNLSAFSGITFRPRRTRGAGWQTSFPGRFRLQSQNEIEVAARCLIEEAYPAT